MQGFRTGNCRRIILVVCIAGIILFTGIVGSVAQATPTATPITKTLKMGSRGSDVITLQQTLKQFGFYTCSSITGVFGAITAQAVKDFQKKVRLYADGVAGPKTLQALYAYSPAADTGTMIPTATLSPTDTPTATVEPTTTPSNALPAVPAGTYRETITLKRGSTGSNVKDLQNALQYRGFYDGKISGVFDAATKTAVINFQRASHIVVDGLAGPATLRVLYTLLGDVIPTDTVTLSSVQVLELLIKSATSVEKLDWKTVDKSIIPRTTVITIIDVETGLTFQGKRTGGTKHCDFETLTKEDTKTFFLIYNKRWSWDRRAIWVIVNGKAYAASINGMPHGYDSISANGLKGQMCIHFVGSRTHGTNRIDPDHQKMIQKAYDLGIAIMTAPTPTPTLTVMPTDAATGG